MSRTYPYILILCILFLAGFGHAATVVRPDPGQRYQVIEGWGLSLCWWAHMMGQWENEAKIDEAIELLTSPDYLNMNIFRYNIPGGNDPSHYSQPGKPGHMAKGKGVRAEMEGFKPTEDAPYEPNADAGQRKVLMKIVERRPDAILEAFSNSPPYWMTHSGCSSGHFDASKDNLKPEYYEAFCQYLLDVCKHYKVAYGIEFKTLEPFNEPTTNYWRYMGSQEGCHFSVETQMKVLRLLHSMLEASGLNTAISASDETNLASGIRALKAYMEAGDIVPLLGRFNVHTYKANPEQREELKSLVKRAKLPFWQSESGPMAQVRRDESYATNLAMAQRLFNDVRHLQPTAWLDWQYMEENNSTWCFIRGEFADEDFRLVKNFYVRMQVTRFVKQGYQIIDSGDDRVLAAVDPKGSELILVLLNEGDEIERFDIDLGAFRVGASAARIYRTSEAENCERLSDLHVDTSQIQYDAPHASITTMLISLTATSM